MNNGLIYKVIRLTRTYCQNKYALSVLFVAYSEPIRIVLNSCMMYQFLKRGTDKCELP